MKRGVDIACSKLWETWECWDNASKFKNQGWRLESKSICLKKKEACLLACLKSNSCTCCDEETVNSKAAAYRDKRRTKRIRERGNVKE